MHPSQLSGHGPSPGRFKIACALVVLLAAGLLAPAGLRAQDATAHVTVLATTDVHGHVWPTDDLRGAPAEWGLAKASTFVKHVRARDPNTLLLDCGDAWQGTPLAYLYAEKYTAEPDPVVEAMNAMHYDVMAVGNHEFNFGLWTLWRLKAEAQFPVLGANIVSTYHDDVRDFSPYVIRTVGDVRVAILGMVTPAIPHWDPPEHLVGYQFRDLVETARHWVPILRQKADVVIVIVHSGLGRDERTGKPLEQIYPEENRAWDIAEQVPGIDAIIFGHSHRRLEGKMVNGVLLVQPKNWAQSVAQVEFDLARDGESGHWRVVDRRSHLVPMDDSIPADPAILDLTRAAHERTERYLSTVVATLAKPLDARTGRVEDHPLVELIQHAQMAEAHAEVSLAALFSAWLSWPAGPVTIREIYALYPYENLLFTVEVSGAQLKQALEYSARSFNTYPWPADASPFADVPGYNYDMAEGVSYRIDLSQPPGERIRDLRFQGAPLDPNRRLRLALNSYRWSGGGGYEMLVHSKVVGRSQEEVREAIINYLLAHGTVSTEVNQNWEIVPAEARRSLLEWVTRPAPAPAALLPTPPPAVSATSPAP